MQESFLRAIEEFARKVFNEPRLKAEVLGGVVSPQGDYLIWKRLVFSTGAKQVFSFAFNPSIMKDKREALRIFKATIRELYEVRQKAGR